MTTKTKTQPEETTAIVTYGEWTPEQMEKEAKEMASGGDFWKPPVGSTTVRFLPPKVGWTSPFTKQHQHFFEVPGVSNKIIFSCPRMHEGKRCLACAKADQLEASGNSRDEKAARKLRPQKRMLSNVIVDPKSADAKPVIWGFGVKVFNQIKAIRENEEGGGNFLDPHKGFNLVVKRVGTGKDDTEYTIIPARNSSPIANMDWIDMQLDCRRLVRIPTVEQQKRLFEGEDPRDVWGDGRADAAHGGNRRRDDAPEVPADEDVIDVDGKEKPRTAEDDLFDDEIEVD